MDATAPLSAYERQQLAAILAASGPDAPQVVDVEATLRALGPLGMPLDVRAVVVVATLRNQLIAALAGGPTRVLAAADRIEQALAEPPLSELRNETPGFGAAVEELLRRARSVPMRSVA